MAFKALKPQTFYTLLALADRDRHGAGIRRQVRDLSQGTVQLWPAMLYSTLEELSDKAWIEELAGEAHPAGRSQRRRYYRITPQGRQVLAGQAEHLSRLAELARSRNPLSQEGGS